MTLYMDYYTTDEKNGVRPVEVLGVSFWSSRKSLVNVSTVFESVIAQELLHSLMLNQAMVLKGRDICPAKSKFSKNSLIMRQMSHTSPFEMTTAWLQYAFNNHDWSSIGLPLVHTDGKSEHVEYILEEMVRACKLFTLLQARKTTVTFILTPEQTPSVEAFCKKNEIAYLGRWNGTEFLNGEA